jgi:hypothetical protein
MLLRTGTSSGILKALYSNCNPIKYKKFFDYLRKYLFLKKDSATRI